ncbi:Kelch repeat-containing protein [Mesoterricola silvestris]|uniref:hypothetical protein n=1 Tax=Mesoterricola silvestris TaxID=2927979 RepID=UPI00292EE348|nr:hypothetical protein [Mesoterricola silvestris]
MAVGGVGEDEAAVRGLEMFEPGPERFREVGGTLFEYQDPALAILRDGSVLVTGASPDEDLYRFRKEPGDVRAELLRWDPEAHSYQASPLSAPPGAYQKAVVLPSGRVLLVGFHSNALFDPGTGRFGNRLPFGGRHAFDDGQGRVLVVGPLGSNPNLFHVRQVDAEAGKTLHEWDVVASEGAAVVRLGDGRLLFAGGRFPTKDKADVVLFDPSSGLRAELAGLLHRRARATALLGQDGRALFIGGDLQSDLPTMIVERYEVQGAR